MARKPDPFYGSRAWRRLANDTVRRWIHAGLPCQVCQKPIGHPRWATVDHIAPVRERPDLALSPANLRVMHRACHSSHTHGRRTRVNAEGYPEGWA